MRAGFPPLIAGPLGARVHSPFRAGKTTISRAVLADTLGIRHFVNADVIAQGLSGFSPDRTAFAAGRLMLERLHELARERESFAFESTLASRTFAPWLRTQIASGYRFHLIYVWLRSPTLSLQRVRQRVRQGGHDVPEETIRRRYDRSIGNLLSLYLPLAESWKFIDNSGRGRPILIARKDTGVPPTILQPSAWKRIQERAHAKDADENQDD